MVRCRQATELMTDDREGKLDGSCRVQFRLHMLICPYCRAFRRQLDVTIAAAKEIARDEVPPAVEEDLVAAFRARNQKGPGDPSR